MLQNNKYHIAITVGVFDLLHEGHAELFSLMDELATLKIVLVHDDASTWENKHRLPVQPLANRLLNVAMYSGALVLPVHESDPSMALIALSAQLRIAPQKVCFVRGNDWGNFPGRQVIEKTLNWGLIFKEYTQGVSSTQIRSGL